MKKIYAADLIKKKEQNEKIVMLTAYDYPTAKILDEVNIDAILVGDSLGMVVYGYENTLRVTLEDVIRHCQAVSGAAKRSLVIADMPFMSYQLNPEEAAYNAARLIKEGGAQAVKLEGGSEFSEAISKIILCQIPVMGHLGLTPQSVYKFGGYKMQGTNPDKASELLREAKRLEELGVFSIVLECIPSDLAKEITQSLSIPTIGIGAGPWCDGQVQVIYDILGLSDFTPKHARKYVDLKEEILKAAKSYKMHVEENKF